MSLNPDGSIMQSSEEAMGKTDSVMSADKNPIGKWHIRGNRLIVQLKDGRFDNVAFKEVIQ